MRIRYERSSVCMGDDVMAPNAYEFDVDEDITIYELAKLVIEQHYLASIQGGKATWVMSCGREQICVIAQQWNRPKMLVKGNRKVCEFNQNEGIRKFYFNYYSQQDPDKVYEFNSNYSEYFFRENLHSFEFIQGNKLYHEVKNTSKKMCLCLLFSVGDKDHIISFKNRYVYIKDDILYFPIHDIKQCISRYSHMQTTDKLANEAIISNVLENPLVSKVYEKNNMLFYLYEPIRDDILVYVDEKRMKIQLSYKVQINEEDSSLIMCKVNKE